MDKDSVEYKAEFAALFAELSWLAVQVNQHTPLCVFIEFMGHVGWCRIEIAESKEKYYNKLILSEFNVDGSMYSNKLPSLADMEKKIAFMKHALEMHEIPYDNAICKRVQVWEENWSF